MISSSRFRNLTAGCFIFFGLCAMSFPLTAQQQLDGTSIIRGVDAAVQARIDNVSSYSDTEHYAVFRSHDENHPAAEMTVKTVYRKGQGKNFTVLSETGSAFVRKEILGSVLDNEKRLSQPGNVETALINSQNYDMKLDSTGPQQIDGRDCLIIFLTPRRNSPFLFKGKLWVDAKDYSIVQLQGTASKSPMFLTGAAEVSRQYSKVNGFPMATHAKAVSNSGLLGQTIVKIDYKEYQVDLQAAN
jgi:outer membrane lipoprotein-sorting protein